MDTFIDVRLMPWTADPLPGLLGDLADMGVTAPPAGIGRGNRSEGVIISYALLEQIAPRISEVLATQIVPHDLPVTRLAVGADLRTSLTSVLVNLTQHGAAASPVVIGRAGTREAAVLPGALFEQVFRDIDLAQAAHVAAKRLGLSDDPNFAEAEFEALCADMRVDPQAVREQMARDAEAGTGPVVSDEPSWNQP